MFHIVNWLLSKFIECTSLSVWLFKVNTRILPAPKTVVRGVPIRVVMPLHQEGVYDAFNAWEKREEETLDWIDSFEADSTFFDIGAGFGTETLYAALKHGVSLRIISTTLLDA